MWKKIIDRNLIVINPEVKNKKDLFKNMVNLAYNNDYITSNKSFLNALLEREEKANTELIAGVGLPHARSESADKLFLSIIIMKDGLDYGNSEMGPVKIVFFFGCPEASNKEYLQLLAKSSRLLRNEELRNRIIACRTKDEVIALLEEFSSSEEGEEPKQNYLMVFTLNEPEYSQDILSTMVELGITNASIVESSSMAKKLAYEMPLFAGLAYMTSGKSKSSELILAHVEDRKTAYQLAELLKENGIDLDKRGVGFIQLIRVEGIIGNFEEDIDL